jgi:hypothetical protein
MLHSVAKIYPGTTPKELTQVHANLNHLAPSDEHEASAKSFRLNFTFRHAPELIGKESEPRFFQLGSKGRQFLDEAHRDSPHES